MHSIMRGARRRLAVAAIAALVACASAVSMAPAAFAEEVPTDAASLTELLASGAKDAKLPAVGQVEKIALGSQGATVTLEGGQSIKLDLSELAGVSGGPNYVGWALLLFGLSVVTRLLTTLSRLLRPFTMHARGRRYRDYE